MKIYLKEHKRDAGKWIYQGYYNAFAALGHDPQWFTDFATVPSSAPLVMAMAADFPDLETVRLIQPTQKVLLFVLATSFPEPYGSHPNFVSRVPEIVRAALNSLSNVQPWAFSKPVSPWFDGWVDVMHLPLAFDSVGYVEDAEVPSYDAVYIGGTADNGFNTKVFRMREFFREVQNSGLNLAVFINRGLSNAEEAGLLRRAKVALNLHDDYQIELGLDVNERTFKSLGLNGNLISDRVTAGVEMFGNRVTWVRTPAEMRAEVEEFCEKPLDRGNREYILKNHTYLERARVILEGV